MASKAPQGKATAKSVGGHLMVRLDAESKAFIAQAAKARRISVSDYVRQRLRASGYAALAVSAGASDAERRGACGRDEGFHPMSVPDYLELLDRTAR